MDKITDKQIENRFKHHAPTSPEIGAKHALIRGMGVTTAFFFKNNLTDSRESSLALTKLEEAMFWANADVARNQNVEEIHCDIFTQGLPGTSDNPDCAGDGHYECNECTHRDCDKFEGTQPSNGPKWKRGCGGIGHQKCGTCLLLKKEPGKYENSWSQVSTFTVETPNGQYTGMVSGGLKIGEFIATAIEARGLSESDHYKLVCNGQPLSGDMFFSGFNPSYLISAKLKLIGVTGKDA